MAELPDLQITCDRFVGAQCLSIRSKRITGFRLTGEYVLESCAAGGWFLCNRNKERPSYWLPVRAVFHRTDSVGRILEEAPATLVRLDIDRLEFVAELSDVPADTALDAVLWEMRTSDLVENLRTPVQTERAGYFLLGSHERYDRPADLFRQLINGAVYETRYSWPHRRRIFSENDAHGLYLIFNGLFKVTGKAIYTIFKQQLVHAVLSRQGEDGGYRHGEWTDDMESHHRLHCSAMHLMMDALGEQDDPSVRSALDRAASFISDKYDTTEVGVWFFHDELEASEAGMQRAPFCWLPSRVLGKSPQNMLVLNTQLDTLIALERYGAITGDARYAALVQSGFDAALAALSLKPMDWLYRILFSAIDLTFMPTNRARRLPLWKRVWKRIGWQLFIPRLPQIKTRFPRLVMPGGYIDRELSLQTWAFDYLAVNLMDLVRAARGPRRTSFMPFVIGILEHCERTGVLQRWTENKRSLYSLGFFAEALILLNVDEPFPEWDSLLAEGLTLCIRHEVGLPPSVNGGNGEFIPKPNAVPQTQDPRVVVANLSTPSSIACLVVNTGKEPTSLQESLVVTQEDWDIPNENLRPGAWRRLEA